MASTVDRASPLASPRALDAPRPGATLTDVLLITGSTIWAVNYTVVKYGTTIMSPLAYNGVRVAIAAAALAVIARGVRGARMTRRDVLALLALGALGNGVYQLLFVEGVARTRAGDVALVLAATPAFVATIGRMTRVERVGARAVLGIALSVAGIGLVVYGAAEGAAGDATLLGDLLVLAGALCWALYTVLLKPYANHIDALRLSAVTMIGGAIPLLVVAAPAIAATPWRHVPLAVWGAIAYGSLGALVIAYLFWYRGVRILGPTRTAMYSNLQPVIALLVAWMLLHEVPTLWQGLGAGTIIAGVVLTRT